MKNSTKMGLWIAAETTVGTALSFITNHIAEGFAFGFPGEVPGVITFRLLKNN